MRIVKIKFRGIDNWNRPVFKDVDSKDHYGSTSKLFSYETDSKTVIDYFSNHLNELEYFGSHFGCEPMGGLSKNITFEIVS